MSHKDPMRHDAEKRQAMPSVAFQLRCTPSSMGSGVTLAILEHRAGHEQHWTAANLLSI